MIEDKSEPPKPKHDFSKSHSFKTMKLHGRWYDRTTCDEPGCPAFPYTLTLTKDLRPENERT